MKISNKLISEYKFLKGMYDDSYFPNNLVKKGEDILINLCCEIEKNPPPTLSELYELTAAATEQFNHLQEKFEKQNSEIETVAREIIANDFFYIAKTYGFSDVDVEELIAERDW